MSVERKEQITIKQDRLAVRLETTTKTVVSESEVYPDLKTARNKKRLKSVLNFGSGMVAASAAYGIGMLGVSEITSSEDTRHRVLGFFLIALTGAVLKLQPHFYKEWTKTGRQIHKINEALHSQPEGVAF